MSSTSSCWSTASGGDDHRCVELRCHLSPGRDRGGRSCRSKSGPNMAHQQRMGSQVSRKPRYSRGSYAYAWESLAGVWVYSFFSLLLTGWLSCPISAAICWTGLALYLRRLESPLPQTAILCSSCGADWSRGTFSQHCRECGGGALEHACLVCGGQCGQQWQRAVIDSRDEHEAHWIGACAHSAHHGS